MLLIQFEDVPTLRRKLIAHVSQLMVDTLPSRSAEWFALHGKIYHRLSLTGLQMARLQVTQESPGRDASGSAVTHTQARITQAAGVRMTASCYIVRTLLSSSGTFWGLIKTNATN
ncbi:hypothetical protein E2C01_049815 [Portunus trituberculatus]|uniref:Uncharacterized protein n=1 Tax=Portunus trituberculatus TaxID=210409 RepID=A0A5B7G6L4_PORTR|nr:hypothetical protein [Portunus trituberculatus]